MGALVTFPNTIYTIPNIATLDLYNVLQFVNFTKFSKTWLKKYTTHKIFTLMIHKHFFKKKDVADCDSFLLSTLRV